jgi:hypothetical protein
MFDTAAATVTLDKWKDTVGAAHVLTGPALEPYLVNGLSISREILAVVQPANETEVCEVVRIAAASKSRLYAFSTGHNWGYGTASPVEDGCVLVDLSRMHRILEFDPELGLITLEPGVTQGQLEAYLVAGKHDFFVPTTGAGPSVSILGNALERGFGITPEEDHFGSVRSLRAVLADGSLYRSSLASLDLPMQESGWKWGIGPYTDGLFSQGNFGIVTAMTIALRRRPEHIEVYVITLKDDARYAELAVACREMLVDLHGLAGGIKFINHHQYRLTLDTAELGMGLSNQFAWIAFGVLHCRKSMVGPLRADLRRRLKPLVSQLIFLNEGRVKRFAALARWTPKPLRDKLARQARQAEDILHIVRGEPRGLELRLVYKHVPIPPGGPRDPVKDGVGIIWYAPIIPLKQDTIQRMVAEIRSTLREFEMTEAVSMTTVNERCAMGVIPILYRRPDDRDRAMECFRALWHRGAALGCFPYRVNVAAMPELAEMTDPVLRRFTAQLKRAVDPHNILSPGRYGERLE